MIEVKWFPPAWVQIKSEESVIYIDPSFINTYYENHPLKIILSKWPDETDGLPEKLEMADLILFTHEHRDHCNKMTVDHLKGKDTILIGPKKCKKEIGSQLKIMKAVEEFSAGDFRINTIQAYNPPKGSSVKKFHKKDSGIGYVVSIGSKKIYHPGDTGFIPEMKELSDIDVAFFPIDGMYTMDVDEAVQAALQISPKIAVPIHDMGKNDPNMFKEKLESESDVEARILTIGESIIL
ncbi:MBL fold metallo-hydrolase [candidate division WOR-3 bacterium]|nr:MBL fold metallo-hydrolase [candidate division WOR-3 bacterium]